MERRFENITINKHIYLITSNGQGIEYGIGTYIQQIVNLLKSCKCFISIINFSNELDGPEVKKENNIRYFNLPLPISVFKSNKEYRYYQSVASFLSLYVNKKAENIFHLNYTHLYYLAKILKEYYPQSKIILSIHYMTWHFYLKGNINQFVQIINKNNNELSDRTEKKIKCMFLQEIKLFKKVDRIICLTNDTKLLLLKHYEIEEEKLEIIQNGIEIKNKILLTPKERIEKRLKLHIQNDEKIILFVGRLTPSKGVEYLIRSFRRVLRVIPNSHLWIIGNGNYDLCLQNANELWGRITFTGRIPQNILYDLYQVADIGVVPSFGEQCSFTVIEMIQLGLPIIGTDAHGMKEIFSKNQDYMINLIEQNNKIEISEEQLSQIIIDKLSRSTPMDNILELQEYYSIDNMKTKMLKLYSI